MLMPSEVSQWCGACPGPAQYSTVSEDLRGVRPAADLKRVSTLNCSIDHRLSSLRWCKLVEGCTRPRGRDARAKMRCAPTLLRCASAAGSKSCCAPLCAVRCRGARALENAQARAKLARLTALTQAPGVRDDRTHTARHCIVIMCVCCTPTLTAARLCGSSKECARLRQ